jgi:hypothetical protein
MVPRSLFRRLGLALSLVSSLPSVALAGHLARRSRPSDPMPAPQHAPAVVCGSTTVTQSSSQTILDQFSVECVDLNTGAHADNSYWRALDLRELGVLGPFDVCEVSLGVEVAASGGGAGQPLTVNLWDQADRAFPSTDDRVLLGTATVAVPDQNSSILTVPVTATAPAYGQLVVEVAIPDGISAGDVFFYGSNDQPETGPTYVSSVSCGIETPEPIADIGFPDVHFVLNVTGTVRPLQPASLTVGDAPGYVVSVGDTFPVKPAWTNDDINAVTLAGTAAPLLVPDGLTATVADSAATYGQIPPSGTADCGSDCYSVQLTGTRPAGHVDVFLAEALDAQFTTAPEDTISPAKDWTIHVGGSFADVPSDSIFYAFVENVFHNGVTAGGACGGYCPDEPTLRKQMAVFVLRALEGPAYTPPPAAGIFTDVPSDDPFAPWIEELYNRGVVAGCGAGPTYCPDDPVLRQQMAVFLLRTLEGSGYTPPACAGVFEDVPCPSPFADWIENLYARGVTGGCNPSPLQYCPASPVTRGQMAPFLVKTFGLLIYGP